MLHRLTTRHDGCAPEKSARTESEQLFERFCGAHSIPVARVDETTIHRPDYRIVLSGADVIVEVKQLELSKEERKVVTQDIETFDASNADHWGIPGEKVRRKIDDAMAQLKALAEGRLPTLLVLYDSVGFWPELLDEYAVKVAMYGIETCLIGSEAAPEGGALILDRWHGGRRKLTPHHNTSLSAIAVLRRDEDSLTLDVFHNWYAANHLSPSLLRNTAVKHFCLSDSPGARFADWISC